MESEPREGLEEYAKTLDLKPEEVMALLDRALLDPPAEASEA